MQEFIGPFATVAAVIALVEFVKQFEVKGKILNALAVVFGVVLSLGDYLLLSGEPTTSAGVYASIISGVFLGLAASGVYVAAKTASTRSVVNVSGAGTAEVAVKADSVVVAETPAVDGDKPVR